MKITINNICAVSTGHQNKIKPQWSRTRYLFINPICLSYHSVRSELSLCCFLVARGKRRSTTCVEPSVPLDTASHVVNVKTFFGRRRRRRRRQKKEKSQSRFCLVLCFYPSYHSVRSELSLCCFLVARGKGRSTTWNLVFLWTRLHMLSTLKRSLEEGEEEEDDKRKKKVNHVSVSFYVSIRAW